MGLLGGLIGDDAPLTIHDWENSSSGVPNLDNSKVKACSTDSPRYVIADENDTKHIVYTESLITCIGVLIHTRAERTDVAGLVHALAGYKHQDTYKRNNELGEPERVMKVIEKINSNYGNPGLVVRFIIGDEPDDNLFRELVSEVAKVKNVEDMKLVYGGKGTPDFENDFRNSYRYAAKVAYDVKMNSGYVGARETKK